MRLLVCGGRTYADRDALWRALDAAHKHRHVALLIHGDCGGADRLAGAWAKSRGIPVQPVPAKWTGKGRGDPAGPQRNQRMIDEFKPDGVCALPGRNGTADMCRRAETAGIPVWRPYG